MAQTATDEGRGSDDDQRPVPRVDAAGKGGRVRQASPFVRRHPEVPDDVAAAFAEVAVGPAVGAKTEYSGKGRRDDDPFGSLRRLARAGLDAEDQHPTQTTGFVDDEVARTERAPGHPFGDRVRRERELPAFPEIRIDHPLRVETHEIVGGFSHDGRTVGSDTEFDRRPRGRFEGRRRDPADAECRVESHILRGRKVTLGCLRSGSWAFSRNEDSASSSDA